MIKEYLKDYSDTITKTMNNIDVAEFEKIIDILVEAYKNDRQVFIMGNGGSAGTANHFVCDFGKNAVLQEGKRRFRILSICDNIEKITALGNDFAFDQIFKQQLINLMQEKDVLISVSASGNSPDLVMACEYAKTKDAQIISLAGFEGGKVKQYAKANLIAPLESYEQIEDMHLIYLHMIVYYIKNHPELL